MLLVFAAAIAESVVASRYLGTEREAADDLAWILRPPCPSTYGFLEQLRA